MEFLVLIVITSDLMSVTLCEQDKQLTIPDDLGKDGQSVAALQRRLANFEHDLLNLGTQVSLVTPLTPAPPRNCVYVSKLQLSDRFSFMWWLGDCCYWSYIKPSKQRILDFNYVVSWVICIYKKECAIKSMIDNVRCWQYTRCVDNGRDQSINRQYCSVRVPTQLRSSTSFSNILQISHLLAVFWRHRSIIIWHYVSKEEYLWKDYTDGSWFRLVGRPTTVKKLQPSGLGLTWS